MEKEDFIEQKQLVEKEIKSIQARIKEINSLLAKIPSLEDLKSLEEFTAEIRERLLDTNWQPTLENKRWILDKLNIKVIVRDGRCIKLTGYLDMPQENWSQYTDGRSSGGG